jgi:hypothetical protein
MMPISLKICLKYHRTQHPIASVYAPTATFAGGRHLALADGFVVNLTKKKFVNA